MTKVLVIATSRKTRGGITSVIKAHEKGEQWKKYHCYWIQTHRDGSLLIKILYLVLAWIQYLFLLPFYDIIHVHGSGNNSAKRKLPFIKLAKKLHKKIIFHFHPPAEKILYGNGNEYLHKIFNLADVILVLSPLWINMINKAFPSNKYNMRVQWNPCPKVNRRNDIRKNQILFAGTIIDRKGYRTLLEAFSKIANKYPDWKIVFAGNGEIDKGKIESENLNISNQVIWLGWVSGKDKEKVFQESSIYCLASWGEGFPMGVLDAWAYGIPCVMTPVGGIPDIVEDGKNGLIFPISDSNKLSEELSLLMSNKDLRGQIVNETDKLVNGIFSIEEVNMRLEELYDYLSNK